MAHIQEPANNSSYVENFHNALLNISRERKKHSILVVDDEEDNLQLLQRTLRRDYNVLTASSAQKALEIVEKFHQNISLIISDQRMPSITGIELLTKINYKYPNIIKMLLTGYVDAEAMIDGVNKCNLFQYITKPFDNDDLKLIVKNGIEAHELIVNKNMLLQDLKDLFFTTIKSISSALDAKDTYTHGHSFRVTLYSLIISNEMNLGESFMEKIETAGLLHDIGKIGVPESILHKPGKLTDEEYDIIKWHPERGYKMLNGIKKLSDVSVWLSSHHERWDGRGYPKKIKNEEIPLAARILAIADTYDAMTSNRSYRKGLPHEVAFEEIKNCAGSQFDPEVVEFFIKVSGTFKEAIDDPVSYYNQYSVINKIFSNNKSEKEINKI